MNRPPNEAVTTAIETQQVRIEEREIDGKTIRWLVFLTPFQAYRVGGYDEAGWEQLISVMQNPQQAAAAADARSRLIKPPQLVRKH